MTDPQPPAEPAAALEPPGPPAAPSPADPRRTRRPASVHLALVIVAVLAGGALFVSGFALGALKATTPGTPVDEAAAFQPFWDAYRSITQDYAGGPVDRKELIDGAIRGMIGAARRPVLGLSQPGGVPPVAPGPVRPVRRDRCPGRDAPGERRRCLRRHRGRLRVHRGRADSRRPGRKGRAAGRGSDRGHRRRDGRRPDLRPGPGQGPRPEGDDRDPQHRPGRRRRRSIFRSSGRSSSSREVTARTLADGSVGYVRLRGFSDRAAGQFSQAVAADVAAGRQKLIVDLRGNPGGYVLDAQQVISQFVPAGTTIFSQEDAAGTRVPTTARGRRRRPRIRRSRSSSSSTAAVPRRARSWPARSRTSAGPSSSGRSRIGKGTVQVWQQLADDNGGFRLTVAKWLTPNGRWIHKVGLTPGRRRRSGRRGGRLRSDARPGARSPRRRAATGAGACARAA